MNLQPPLSNDAADPHAGQRVLTSGPDPKESGAVVVLVHGRGGTAESMLSVYRVLGLPALAAIAPEAAGNAWYPKTFLAPLEANQPFLDSALRRIESLVSEFLGRGISSERIGLLGFSQGACLTLEFIARNPRRYGAVIGLTGGLIGPQGTPRDDCGSLAGTPVFLGSSDPDPHVPFERVEETAAVLARMGAKVDLRRYPGLPHTINTDEMDASRTLLQAMLPVVPERNL